ncbi:hypothetical protein [Streptomyces sp. NPDC002851]
MAGRRVNKPTAQALEGWTRVIERFGDWSMYRFLTEHAKLDQNTIDLIGTIENLTSRLALSFIHSFVDASLINPQSRFYELDGGTAKLPDALLALVRDQVRFDRRVTRIEYAATARPDPDVTHADADGPRVWVDTVSGGR